MITEAAALPTLTVAVVVHNSDVERLAATLGRLAMALRHAAAEQLLGSARVFVYDNASSPGYREQLQHVLDAQAPGFAAFSLDLLLGPRNLGYGAGVNRAVAASRDSCLLVLNPDMELAADALQCGLQALAAHASAVAVGPRCRRADGSDEFLCKRYPAVVDLLLRAGPAVLRRPFAARLGRYEYRDRDAGEGGEVELLSGACMLLRRSAYAAVDGFDERYFMYFEDFDLSLRLARHGALRYEPTMQAIHHGGFAARKGWRHVRWIAASALRFYRTHGWRWF